MNFIEAILDFLFPKKVIPNCEHVPYLHRWYLVRTKPFAIFIHKFVRSDWDRDLHDHPWPFIVIPIWRGYVEWSDGPIREIFHANSGQTFRVPTNIARRVLPIIGARKQKSTYKHRVQLLTRPLTPHIDGEPDHEELPAWSIFIRFRECREWGFWTSKGWVKWNQWWQQNCV